MYNIFNCLMSYVNKNYAKKLQIKNKCLWFFFYYYYLYTIGLAYSENQASGYLIKILEGPCVNQLIIFFIYYVLLFLLDVKQKTTTRQHDFYTFVFLLC